MALKRSETDKMFAGVCGGIAIEMGVDTTIVRGVFIVLSLLGMSGGVIYALLWLVMPRTGGGTALGDILDNNSRRRLR